MFEVIRYKQGNRKAESRTILATLPDKLSAFQFIVDQLKEADLYRVDMAVRDADIKRNILWGLLNNKGYRINSLEPDNTWLRFYSLSDFEQWLETGQYNGLPAPEGVGVIGVCECCGDEAALGKHHWWEAPPKTKETMKTKMICSKCNSALATPQGEDNHILQSWRKQKAFALKYRTGQTPSLVSPSLA